MASDNTAINYEPEADVLSWEVSDKPIDFAKETGNVVVHFSKDQSPVLIEVLGATEFLRESTRLVRRQSRTAV